MSLNRAILALTFSLTALLPAAGNAAVLRDESTGGDLSGNRNAPTPFTLSPGSNEIIATSGAGDLEYFTLTTSFPISQVFLRSYSGPDGTAFIGVQNGATFTEDSTFPNQANLLGYSHFGPELGHVGADILPAIGNGFGAQGFTPPLPPGQYTFWAQQTGAASNYRLDFVVVPEPAAGLIVMITGLLALPRRRSQQGKSRGTQIPCIP